MEIVKKCDEEISLRKASEITGIKYHTLYKWFVIEGKIPCRDYKPLKMFSMADVKAFKDAHTVKTNCATI